MRRGVVIAVPMVAVAVAVPVGVSSGAARAPAPPIPPSVVRMLREVTQRYVAADDLVSDVQVLPDAAEIRDGAESPTASQLQRERTVDAGDRSSDSRLTALLRNAAAGLTHAARDSGSTTTRRADRTFAGVFGADESLLGTFTNYLTVADRKLAADIGAARASVTRAEAAPADAPARAAAAGPPSGLPAVVSLGDSYISGEGGRWAGNSNASPDLTDTGPVAYDHDPEAIAGCHRSASAEISIFHGLRPPGQGASLNLACSGATTSTDNGALFKPGIDFYPTTPFGPTTNATYPMVGQAFMLRKFGALDPVKMVVLSIGGNDFHFSDVIKTCVGDYIQTNLVRTFAAAEGNPFAATNAGVYCNTDPAVLQQISQAARVQRTGAILGAMKNVYEALRQDGYQPGSWKLVVQLYPAPIAASSNFRYSAGGERQSEGGCGVLDADLDWASNSFLPIVNQAVLSAGHQFEALFSRVDPVIYLRTDPTFAGHQLCSKSDRLVTSSWHDQGAAKSAEWFTQIRTLTTKGYSPFATQYLLQEGLHPDYWGQLAMRNCLRQLYDRGAVVNYRGGSIWQCNDESGTTNTGLNYLGEPLVKLVQG